MSTCFCQPVSAPVKSTNTTEMGAPSVGSQQLCHKPDKDNAKSFSTESTENCYPSLIWLRFQASQHCTMRSFNLQHWYCVLVTSSNLHQRTIAFHNHAAMQCIMPTLNNTLWTKRQFFAPIQRPSRWTPPEPVALMFDSTPNASTVPPPAPFTPYHRRVGRMILFGATRCCLNHEMQ